jgi:putative zinc finger/helix-turn-helix YgiT family protein
MKPFPWKCGECRERAIYPTVLETYTTELDHDGKTYPISVSNFEVMQCRNCTEIILDDDANRTLSDALRSTVGLLQPTEIRAQREKLGLTQKTLAAHLQIAEATLSRWETGAQIQQRAMDRFLRVFFLSAEVRSILGALGQERTAASDTVAAPITVGYVQTDASVDS